MHVIFFDGVCGLCNGFVDFVMRMDKKNIFHFAPLQGEYAAQHLPQSDTSDLSSVVFMSDGKTLRKSHAVLGVFRMLGLPLSLLDVAKVIPQPLLDMIYDWVASNRYRWFGQKDTCRIPTPSERSRFLN